MSMLLHRAGVQQSQAAAPPSGPWAPTDDADLGFWLDPVDTSAASIVATGNDLATLNDLSGNGRHFTAGNDPQTGVRTFNGHNVIDFASALSQYLQNTAYIPQGSFQITGAFIVDEVTGGDESAFRIGGGIRTQLRAHFANQFLSEVYMTGTGNNSSSAISSNMEGVLALYRIVYDLDGTNDYEMFLNETSAHVQTDGYELQFDAERFVFMSAHPSLNYLDGAFGGAILRENIDPAIGQRDAGFIAHRLSAAGTNLPVGHPYKDAPPMIGGS